MLQYKEVTSRNPHESSDALYECNAMRSPIKAQPYQSLFATEHIERDLKEKSIRGGFYTMCSEGITSVLRVGSIAILARILIPEYFGLLSMVTALTAFAERFNDLGLSDATIQQKQITHEQVSTLFWINLAFGVILMIGIAVSSNLIAWFYGDARLIWITIAIASSFFWSGLSVQHQALLRRQMQFAKIAGVNLGATALSIIIAIYLALNGYGYWALVWREVTRNVFIAIGTWVVCPWMPGPPARFSTVGSMIKFGRDICGFNIIHFFASSLDQVLIGKVYGAAPLGFYRQAWQLMYIPISVIQFPVHYVAESTLSVIQSNREKYRECYQKILTLVSFVSIPLAVYLFLYAKDIVLLVLGQKWLPASELFQILSILAFVAPLSNTTGFVMITCGKSKRYLFVGVLSAITLILAFSIGIMWGARGVAIGYAAAVCIVFVPSLCIAFRGTPITLGLFFRSILRPMFASVIMAVVLALYSNLIVLESSAGAIGTSLVIAVAVYLGMWTVIPGGRRTLMEMLSYVRVIGDSQRMQRQTQCT
jgi:PST family polysaccharide transporter